MADNYQYQQKPLPPKTEFGGNAQNDAGVPITAPDPYPVSSALSTPPPFAEDGNTTGGGGGVLPVGSEGDLLRHNGTSWVAIAAPSGLNTGLLQNSHDRYSWIEGAQKNEIVYYGGPDGGFEWRKLAAPSETGNFMLSVQDGAMIWQEITDC